MKMVVAYIDRDRFDPIRADLLEHGFLSLSVVEAQGSFPTPPSSAATAAPSSNATSARSTASSASSATRR